MKPLNVLVFPGGTEIGLEINRALRECKEVRLFSAGQTISNHAPFVYRHHFELPSIHEAGWIAALNQILEVEQIEFIFPAYDDIILALASHAEQINARIVTSPLETCRLCRSKLKTYQSLAELLPVPRIFERIKDVEQYPVFVKPDIGQGSQGAVLVHTEAQLGSLIDDYAAAEKRLLVMEYLPGAEYTVDCFSHRSQGLLYASGRERVRTKSGISMASRAVSDSIFQEYAHIISQHISLYGAWFFQLKQDVSGHFRLLEVAPRIAGTMALNRVKGVNFPLLSLYEAMNLPLKIMTHSIDVEIDRALINRYRHNYSFDVLYIDFDDMLIVKDVVNLDAIRLVYQCINQGKRVILLTRHHGDLLATLRRFHLSSVFDEIIHVETNQQKADFIREERAIFVDDSFRERELVSQQCGIPTFDSSMIEMLFDDKV